MQNMERFFGFSVKISDFLEPADFRFIRDKIVQAITQQGIDSSKYRIYLHQLVLAASSSRFGIDGGLSNRVSEIFLKFSVNQKQRRTDNIRFMNYMFKPEMHSDIGHYYLPYEIGYTIPATFFCSDRQWFQNLIITFVHVGTRESHKKIKVTVAATPSPQYFETLKDTMNADAITKIDLDYRHSIEFNRQTKMFLYPPEARVTKESSGGNRHVINIENLGALNVDSPNSSAYGNVSVLTDRTLLDHVLKELKTIRKDLANSHADSIPQKDLAVFDGVIVGSSRQMPRRLGD